MSVSRLEQSLGETAAAVNDCLDRLLPEPAGPEGRVAEAMRYAALGGGKRLRPFLLIASARLFGVEGERPLRAAAAVEMIHAYSLVHDDLPAMDDDDLRRGRPSCHIRFDEATAILAGDALLTYAFEVMTESETHGDAGVRCELARGLSAASGAAGMVGGQMVDLLAADNHLDLDGVTHLQNLKTGALIAFSCEGGAILGEASPDSRAGLAAYGRDLGLAFQIADDLLDIEGSAAELGKAVGKDAEAGKATFVSLLGVAGARDYADQLVARAVARLEIFDGRAGLLADAARFVVDRRH
ncbi:MAG: polyprenyl synthetase family protein [Proteobacteria bacterium]|nr:polyprenyl synthetase family protein [Pseudomonadota bacterium]